MVLNSYDAIKEAFVEKAGEFSDRPRNFGDITQLRDGKRTEMLILHLFKHSASSLLICERSF